MKREDNSIWVNFIIIVMFLAYLMLGIGVCRDYGISSDEPTERLSTLINVKYVLTSFKVECMSGFDVPDLETYDCRNYGTFLQMPSVIFEVIGKDIGDVFLGRHFYTFLICVIGYVFSFCC